MKLAIKHVDIRYPSDTEEYANFNKFQLIVKMVEFEKDILKFVPYAFDNIINHIRYMNLNVELNIDVLHFLNFIKGRKWLCPTILVRMLATRMGRMAMSIKQRDSLL